MVASGHVDKGAIYSIAGDSKWAASSGFDVRLPTHTHVFWTPRLGMELEISYRTSYRRGC